MDLFIKQINYLTPYAAIFIRLAFGYHLLYYSWDNVIHLDAASSADFLAGMGIPFPKLMSWLYVITEFIGGIALIIGYQVRLVAIPLIFTFLVAYFIAHFGDTYQNSFQALQMLSVSLFFLFHGSGRISIDELSGSKKMNP